MVIGVFDLNPSPETSTDPPAGALVSETVNGPAPVEGDGVDVGFGVGVLHSTAVDVAVGAGLVVEHGVGEGDVVGVSVGGGVSVGVAVGDPVGVAVGVGVGEGETPKAGTETSATKKNAPKAAITARPKAEHLRFTSHTSVRVRRVINVARRRVHGRRSSGQTGVLRIRRDRRGLPSASG
jgi:hypothetical protein